MKINWIPDRVRDDESGKGLVLANRTQPLWAGVTEVRKPKPIHRAEALRKSNLGTGRTAVRKTRKQGPEGFWF
jgi:hypothetical protein